MALIYTTVIHKFRKANNLSCNEYILADMIYYLSTSPESKIVGWCYMGREKMADELGLTKQSILNIIQSLITKGFIIKDEETSFLKTTRAWNLVYFTEGKESIPNDQKSLPKSGKESIPYINNTNNKRDSKRVYEDFPLLDNDLLPLWNEYLKMRIGIKKRATPQAEKLMLKKLFEYSKDNKGVAAQILENSIMGSWISLYPLKDEVQLSTQLELTGELQANHNGPKL